MPYPKVKIHNSTPYICKGKVFYASIFCSDDNYTVTPSPDTWVAASRGVCLVTKITAHVHLDDGTIVEAKPYTSSGTSYSDFSVISRGKEYVVTRVVFGADAEVGDISDYVEPTEKQK